MSPAVPRKVIVGFSLGFAILAVNALIDYRSFVTLTEATDSVQEGLQTRDLLKGIRSAVVDSETGQRNYILTEMFQREQSYEDAVRKAGGNIGLDPTSPDWGKHRKAVVAALGYRARRGPRRPPPAR